MQAFLPTEKTVQGIGIYRELCTQKGINLLIADRRISYLLYEHKVIMEKRIEYMWEEKLINEELYKKLKLFSNFYIPVELIECNNSEIKEYEINYSEEEAKEEAKRRAEEKLNQKITNKDNINNVTVNYTIKDDAVEAEVTYEVFENIGTNEKIVF